MYDREGCQQHSAADKNTKQKGLEMTKNEILAVFANEVFCVESSSARYDDDENYINDFSTKVKDNISIAAVVDNIFHEAEENEICELESAITDLNSLIRLYNEFNDNAPYYSEKLHIQSVYKEQAAEKTRQSLETDAASFARKHQTGGVNTLFIQKLLEEMQSIQQQQSDWNSAERRMERHAICASSGCRDSFWEDNDYENGKFDTRQDRLQKLFDYIQEHLPLLWAKYELQQ